MTFIVGAEAYTRFMGRWSEPLAGELLRLLGVGPGDRALDVGCGPGALTALLVEAGAEVSAVDPSPPFIEALRARLPGVEAHIGPAESLPFPDGHFDVSAAQLVVQFMSDPVAGLAEMGRVTRPTGTVAACVWDAAGGGSPLSPFWRAVNVMVPGARDERAQAGGREGHLAELATAAGLTVVESTLLTVSTRMASFEDWWAPFTLGVGPAGAYLAGLGASDTARLEELCRRELPTGSFEAPASAWTVLARTTGRG